MKKRIIAMYIVLFLVALVLFGCSAKKSPLAVNKITFVCYSGDTPNVELFVITPDCNVKKYAFSQELTDNFDLYSGELPPKDKYTLTNKTISEEDWNSLVDSLSENGFMSLPKDLACMGVCDAPSHYIGIETADNSHWSGGYGALCETKNRKNKRFIKIANVLYDVIGK